MPSFLLLLLTLAPLVAAQRGDQRNSGKGGENCCLCVPFYACNEEGKVDFIRLGKFKALVDGNLHEEPNAQHNPSVATNPLNCENHLEFCCLLPNVTSKNCDPPTIPKINKEPQPHVQCECTHWELCPLDSLVTDGKGKGSKVEEFGLVSHSKCKEELQVCCKDEMTVSTRTGAGNDQVDQECECLPLHQCLPDGTLNTDGTGIIEPRFRNRTETVDPRFGNRSHCGNDEVCCRKSGTGTGGGTGTGTGGGTGTGTGGGTGGSTGAKTGGGNMRTCNSKFIGCLLLVLGFVFKSS